MFTPPSAYRRLPPRCCRPRRCTAFSHHKLNSLGGVSARGATRFATGVFYFVLMELLQGVSYSTARIADWTDAEGELTRDSKQCESMTNQFLTILGFLHICGQPFFTHLMCGAFYHRDPVTGKGGTKAIENDFTLRIAFLGG